jgi:hypothetical protein
MRACAAILFSILLSAGGTTGAELTSQQLAAQAQDSLVFIATRYFDENTSQTKAAGSGSGVVITSNGLVLTAYHVVKEWNAQSDDDKLNNPLRIRLGSSHGDEVDAQIVGVNDQYDVALLQILRPGKYPAAGVCFANTLEPGESVTGFGFPDGLERQSSPGTFGNASADNGRWAVSFNNAEGMSGGPLYDGFGDVVGIIRGTYGGQGASNVVTPVRRARSLIEDQTRFTEDCRRDAPAPAPAADDWYGGSVWKDPDDMCGDIQQMIAATGNLKSLHLAESGKAAADGQYGGIRENLAFTEASNMSPNCAIDENGDPTVRDRSVLACDINVSTSLETFQKVLTTAGTELGACMSRLKWTPGDKSEHCALSPDGLGCYYDWRKDGRAIELYGFWAGDPPLYGLGVYASIPDKR